MNDKLIKTVSIYSGNVFGPREWGHHNESIGLEVFCEHCKENSKAMIIELHSTRHAPFASQDLSRDQIKQLIELLREAL